MLERIEAALLALGDPTQVIATPDNNLLEPKIRRPWGGYTILKKTPTYWVKKLFVLPNTRLSLQSHQHRHEVWFVLSGTIIAQIRNKKCHAKPGTLLTVPKGQKHRIIGVTEAVILEVAFGKVLETDIVRYEDDYGRVSHHSRFA